MKDVAGIKVNKTTTLLIMLVIFAFTVELGEARSNHMTLLTVGEEEGTGGTADLYLETRPGEGRVFIDSFPLTKLDTQITTRYSKEMACNYADVNCNNRDFFYTIRAQTSLIGGPSAGAAKTVLTVANIKNLDLDPKVTITGTINSGGIIGPVAGIEDKIVAARQAGMEKVLIPKWNSVAASPISNTSSAENQTDYNIDGIEVVRVSTIEEALEEFTGKSFKREEKELVIPDEYQDIMSSISTDLCSRTDEILEELDDEVKNNNTILIAEAERNINLSKEAISREDYYSAASYCFSANTDLRTLEFEQYSNETLEEIHSDLKKKKEFLHESVDNMPLNTISNLESNIIVKERLFEASELLDLGLGSLGFAKERLHSAESWSKFFEYEGEPMQLEENHLRNTCLSKISEVEERTNYVDFMFGESIRNEDTLGDLRSIYQEGDYPFCIFRATRIKADINSLLLTSTVSPNQYQELLNDKLRTSKLHVADSKSFPIIGYSYYNYAESVRFDSPENAMLFSEYSSEFSNLDMYFEDDSIRFDLFWVSSLNNAKFFLGLFLGIALTLIVIGKSVVDKNKYGKKSKKHRKRLKPRKISKRNPPGKKR